MFVPICLYVSLKDWRVFFLSPIVSSFMNSQVWIHLTHCAGSSPSSFNMLTHVLFLNYFTDDFFPIFALFLVSGTLIISILDLLNQSSLFFIFFIFFFSFLSLCIFCSSFWKVPEHFLQHLWDFISALILLISKSSFLVLQMIWLICIAP